MELVRSCCAKASPTELYWVFKALLTSSQEAATERLLSAFDKNEWPMLKTGGVFALVNPGEVDVSGDQSLVSSTLKQVTKLIAVTAVPANKPPVKAYQVLVRLVRATPAAKQTYLEWSTLELAENKPKFSGQVPLFKVQTIKERNGGICFSAANGDVLFEAKSLTEQASIEAGKWVKAFQAAVVALAPAIEEESAKASGMTDRVKKLELLEQKKQKAEEAKRLLAANGPVTMAHTARIMAER